MPAISRPGCPLCVAGMNLQQRTVPKQGGVRIFGLIEPWIPPACEPGHLVPSLAFPDLLAMINTRLVPPPVLAAAAG